MADSDEYEIVLINNEIDARSCAKLLSEELTLHNKLRNFYQINVDEYFNQRIWPLIIDVLDQKLSFLIRYRPTNDIVAVMLATDLYLYCKNHPYDEFSPPSDPVQDLYAEMLNQFVHYDFDKELKPNMVLQITAGATRFDHTGKGLAAKLRAHLCNYTRDTKGFQYAFIQTGHPATRHIYINKMNGKEITIIHPANWLWKKKDDGLSRPFKDYKDEPAVNILVNLNKQI
ncbi:unnamed protein product [Rotaria sp. Silwood1]|nr:unnamed protein product [Rotaria sp. Silwood1]CAF4047634.1 unnamed protein product [Rotaria sp. Silwood1]CAF5042433.1 unnamed protein product [Rotaria sp. Silwood1]CAF5112520.1 unnamed protein product [Rotaria sp. Silwood1]